MYHRKSVLFPARRTIFLFFLSFKNEKHSGCLGKSVFDLLTLFQGFIYNCVEIVDIEVIY